MREWCGGEWLPFESISNGEQVSIWEADLFYPKRGVDYDREIAWLLRETALVHQETILEREFGANERLEMPVTWLSSSLEELELFLTHYYRIDSAMVMKNFDFQGDDWDGLFKGQLISKGIGGGGGSFINTPDFSIGWPVHETMQYFCNVKALTWIPVEGEDPTKRRGWQCLAPFIDYKVQLSREVTSHENVEALLYLRDWLRGKVPDNEIESCLLAIQT